MRRQKFRRGSAREGEFPPIDTNIPDEVLEDIRTGKTTFTQFLQTRIPSMAEQARWRVDREREEKAASTAKRLAARAARNDPAKIADQQARWAARQAKWDKARVEREAADAARKAAIAENPTLRWRTPRRKDWAKKNLANAK